MKQPPFKFRHVNKVAGAFIFLSLALLFVIFGLAGKAQQWFEPSFTYRVLMPYEEGTLGITAGSDVQVFGNHVGHVKKIEVVRSTTRKAVSSFENVLPSELGIVAVLSVKGDFCHFIGEDSEATLKNTMGGLGAAYFDITRGTDERSASNEWLELKRDGDVKKQMMEIVMELKDVALPAVKQIERASSETANLVSKLSKDDGELFTSLDTMNSNLERLDSVIELIENGKGPLGLLLKDDKTRANISKLLADLSGTSENLKSTTGNVDLTVAKLQTGIDSINEAAIELPQIMRNTDQTILEYGEAATSMNEVMREAEILTEGIQKHWLIRKNMHDPIEDPKPEDEATKAKRDKGPPKSLKR